MSASAVPAPLPGDPGDPGPRDPVHPGGGQGAAVDRAAIAVYAAITLLGVITAATSKQVADSAAELGVVIVGTAVTLMVAHAWSSVVAHRLVERRRFTREEILAEFVHDGAFVTIAGVAVLALAVSAAVTDDFDTQVSIEQATLVGLLVVVGIVGARRSGATWPRALAWGAVDGAVGLLVVAFKLLLGA